jgi:hypothetical protein
MTHSTPLLNAKSAQLSPIAWYHKPRKYSLVGLPWAPGHPHKYISTLVYFTRCVPEYHEAYQGGITSISPEYYADINRTFLVVNLSALGLRLRVQQRHRRRERERERAREREMGEWN